MEVYTKINQIISLIAIMALSMGMTIKGHNWQELMTATKETFPAIAVKHSIGSIECEQNMQLTINNKPTNLKFSKTNKDGVVTYKLQRNGETFIHTESCKSTYPALDTMRKQMNSLGNNKQAQHDALFPTTNAFDATQLTPTDLLFPDISPANLLFPDLPGYVQVTKGPRDFLAVETFKSYMPWYKKLAYV